MILLSTTFIVKVFGDIFLNFVSLKKMSFHWTLISIWFLWHIKPFIEKEGLKILKSFQPFLVSSKPRSYKEKKKALYLICLRKYPLRKCCTFDKCTLNFGRPQCVEKKHTFQRGRGERYPVLRNRAILPRFRFRVPNFLSTVSVPVPAPVPVPTLKF